MGFSDIIKRCRLETLSEFLISGDSILKEIADILEFDYDIVFTDRKTGKKI